MCDPSCCTRVVSCGTTHKEGDGMSKMSSVGLGILRAVASLWFGRLLSKDSPARPPQREARRSDS